MLEDSALYYAFEQSKRVGAIAQVHAENGSIIAEVYYELLFSKLIDRSLFVYELNAVCDLKSLEPVNEFAQMFQMTDIGILIRSCTE